MADPDDVKPAEPVFRPMPASPPDHIGLPKGVANLIETIALIVSTDHAMAAQIDRVICDSPSLPGRTLDTDALRAASRRHRVMALEGEARIKALVHRHGYIVAPDGGRV